MRNTRDHLHQHHPPQPPSVHYKIITTRSRPGDCWKTWQHMQTRQSRHRQTNISQHPLLLGEKHTYISWSSSSKAFFVVSYLKRIKINPVDNDLVLLDILWPGRLKIITDSAHKCTHTPARCLNMVKDIPCTQKHALYALFPMYTSKSTVHTHIQARNTVKTPFLPPAWWAVSTIATVVLIQRFLGN